jgi:hypothetical protein
VMEEYASGFAGHPGGYFILEYQTPGFSSRMQRVFNEQCLWFPNGGFSADFVPRGRCFAYSAKINFPNSFENSKVRIHK